MKVGGYGLICAQQYLLLVRMSAGEELKKIENEIAHLQQKYEIQQKRINFLKRENEELREKQANDGLTSQQIREQNERLKRRNRQLKSQLGQLKQVMLTLNAQSAPRTTTIKDLVITPQTEEIDLPHREVGDEDIESIRDFRGIKSLILGQNSISNFGLYTICSSFQDLRKLFLNHNQITDDGIGAIVRLKQLRCLDLRCNKISGEALKHIGQLSLLAQLSLSNNDIGNEHLEALLQLTELQYLDITSNRIGEAGGLILSQLKSLANLYLSHNKITLQCVISYLQIPTLKVLDVRFNPLSQQEKQMVRSMKSEYLQLFL